MSVGKWAYSPERCDGEICVGDCDLCQKAKTSPSNVWMKIGEHIGEIMNLLFEDTTKMTTEEAIDQLASMKCHAEDMRDAEDERSVWAKDIQAICMAIEALKKQPQQARWIPCSERMPEVSDYYLIQHSRHICRDEMAVAFYSVEEAELDENYTWEFKPFADCKEVIAWMPLPKPYEPQESEENNE